MSSKKEGKSAYVKQETMFLVAIIALFIGFVGGVVFTSYKQVASEKSSAKVSTQEEDHEGHVHPEPGQTQESQQAQQAQRVAMMIQSLEQEIQKHPDNVELRIQLGNSYFDSNMFQKAVDAYQKATEIDPNNANVLTDMGVMYRRLKQPEKALEAFDKAASVDPSHESCRFNKGIVLMHDLNDMDGAIKTWEELIKINPLAKGPNGMPIAEFIEKLKNK